MLSSAPGAAFRIVARICSMMRCTSGGKLAMYSSTSLATAAVVFMRILSEHEGNLDHLTSVTVEGTGR